MKILFLVTDLVNSYGGIKAFNNNILKALLELEHTVRVISINDVDNLGDNAIKLDSCGKHKHFRKLLFIIYTIKNALLFRPSLILCGHIAFVNLCFFVNKLFQVPYISITHGIESWKIKRINFIGLKNSKKILSVSNYTKNKILGQLPDYSSDKILILPNTFCADKFKPADKSQSLMKKLKINPEDKVILTIARLSKAEQYKGYDKVILAMDEVRKEIPNIKYVIGGTGDDTDRIHKLIEDNALEESVILAGYIPEEEIADYYNVCDVFVMPSKGEGFGIVFLEALACGKPVIGGSKDGSRDALMNGTLGSLVDPDNVEDIWRAIIEVLEIKIGRENYDRSHYRKKVIAEYGYNMFRERLEMCLTE